MAVSMAAKISQLACFSSTSSHFHLQRRSFACPRFRTQSFVVRSIDGNSSGTAGSENKTSLSYAAEVSKPFGEKAVEPFSNLDENGTGKRETTEPGEQQHVVTEHKRGAKIHDFCFGIPYGGLILCGGLLGSMFSRNLTSLSTGVLYGGALLALSTLSLKIWRQGKSSVPFILGQAVVSAVLFWKNFGAYSMTKKLMPSGFFAAISAAMLCFYSYVVISGGNPPPKKLKPSTNASY
ncbi:PREDICTED: protein FATTY ACID EXPORT 1, chloroplastic-like [Tarenaya hassleriana]|uniref:protein FATTY ACID EXPORT 1, chloroplastic-like n=1 Tax=Tarenaya hassleriana TaxID=28532 RepID=UPI00053C92B8|nr:PREDICTED: protein FATTY ACID EXPORT 1, chloroplastic-like [Tarenaya hassleriana]